MLTLEEPWRGRFLALAANLATGGNWSAPEETVQDYVLGWLRGSLSLRRHMALMLNAWRRPE